jgi:hypothetical protein
VRDKLSWYKHSRAEASFPGINVDEARGKPSEYIVRKREASFPDAKLEGERQASVAEI